MYKKLYIAEKPDLGREIAKGLVALSKRPGNEQGDSIVGVKGERGNAYLVVGEIAVTHFIGHMYEQFEPDDYDPGFAGSFRKSAQRLPAIPDVWKLKPVARTRKQLDVVNQLIRESAVIVHAGDPDDEGQLLVDEALEFIGNRKPTLRLLLNALDPASVQAALRSEQDNAVYAPIYHAALARQRADWLVGMNMTRACTVANTAGDMLTVGRVQTPTAALLVARRLAIEQFKPQNYFAPTPEFEHQNGRYTGRWQAPAGQAGLDEKGRLLDEALARSIIENVQGQTGQIVQYAVEGSSQRQPLPFSLPALQVRASKVYGMSAARVLDVAQSLYETHKIASYPRTDSGYLKQSQHADAPAVLAAIAKLDAATAALVAGANPAVKSPAWNDKEVAAHHGIIPTAAPNYLNLTVDERKIFGLIVKQYLAQFYPEYTYHQTTVLTECGGHRFKSSGRTPIDLGWRKVFGADELEPDKKGEDDEDQNLPQMRAADPVKCVRAENGAKTTKPPKHYTEGTLLQAMSNIAETIEDPEQRKRLKACKGIGTPATQSKTIERLKEVGYAEIKGKNIIASDGCVTFIRAMPKELTDACMTAMWQMAMDRVKARELTLEQFMQGQISWVSALTKKTLATPISIVLKKDASVGSGGVLEDCPKCGKGKLRQRMAKKGPNAGKPFLACTAYPDCNYTRNVAANAGAAGKSGAGKGGAAAAKAHTGRARS